MLGRSWFSSFRLLFKERLGSLSCSRSGEDTSLLRPDFVKHIDVDLFSLGGAPIKQVGQINILIPIFFKQFQETMIDAL